MKRKYVVRKIVNQPGSEVSFDVYLADRDGMEFVGEFHKRKDATLFAKAANARADGRKTCV